MCFISEIYIYQTLCRPASGFEDDLESVKGAGKREKNGNTAYIFKDDRVRQK